MRITLIGHGNTGRVVARVAEEQGHRIAHRITRANRSLLQGQWGRETDVAIDFSVAEAVADNARAAVAARVPLVIGTTAWGHRFDEVRSLVEQNGGACVYASNFSVGVQVLFQLARHAARLLGSRAGFQAYIRESHRAGKKDSPSGTALTLKNVLEESCPGVEISSLRAGFIPGSHTVGFDSPAETLELEHVSRSREGFAQGALLAAEWIRSRRGFHSFEEVLFDRIED